MGYEESAIWKDYYNETDPKKRQALFDTISSENEDDGANALRKKLFDNRHYDKKKSVKDIDRGMWQFLSMMVNINSPVRSPKAAKKEIDEAMKILGLNEKEAETEPGRSAVYWEIRNLTKRYLKTCTDPGYGRKLFGIMNSSEEEKLEKTVEEIYLLARQIPKRYAMQEELTLFTGALEDEFLSWSDEAKEGYLEYIKKKEG